jgi:transcriptional regulator with XRE-family HTH domain
VTGLGENVRLLRTAQGVTQTELAQLASVRPAYISQIEAGKRTPSLSALDRIALALGVSRAVLLGAPEEGSRGAALLGTLQALRYLLDLDEERRG